MGFTNQEELDREKRNAACIRTYFDLKKAQDRLGFPEFKSPNEKEENDLQLLKHHLETTIGILEQIVSKRMLR